MKPLPYQLPTAKQVIVSTKTTSLERQLDSDHVISVLRASYSGKFIFTGSKIWLPFYGKKLLVIVKSIVLDNESSEDTHAETSLSETLDTTCTSEKSLSDYDMYSSTPKRQAQPLTGSTLLCRESSLEGSNLDISESARSSHIVSSSFDSSLQELENNLSHLSLGSEEEPRGLKILCRISDVTEFVLDLEDMKEGSSDRDIHIYPEIHLCGLDSLKKKIAHFLSLALDLHGISRLKKQKGMLLYGPSGSGKTQLIRLLARELNISLCEMQSADIYSKFLGETESRIKEFFDEAKSKQPALLLLDKIDWLSSSNLNSSGATDLGRRAVDTLALNLDSLQDSAGVAVIATACSLDMIDASLRRPGR